MSNEVQEVRCSACRRLLAKLRDGLLTIHRGDLEVTIDGECSAAFVCGRPRCHRLNVVRVRSHPPSSMASGR